jgi:hypothetical protein
MEGMPAQSAEKASWSYLAFLILEKAAVVKPVSSRRYLHSWVGLLIPRFPNCGIERHSPDLLPLLKLGIITVHTHCGGVEAIQRAKIRPALSPIRHEHPMEVHVHHSRQPTSVCPCTLLPFCSRNFMSRTQYSQGQSLNLAFATYL